MNISVLCLLAAQAAAAPLSASTNDGPAVAPVGAEQAAPGPAAGAEAAPAPADAAAPTVAASGAPPAEELLARLGAGALGQLAAEVLERNPELARARARAAAAAARAPQVRALPDPMAGLTVYPLPPETRVGPVRGMAMLSQTFPWFGKLRLREQTALLEAAAAEAEVDAAALLLVTEIRRLAHELAFLDAFEAVVREDRETLAYYEEVARTRYAAGVGLGQSVVKIQAEITKDDDRLLEIASRRASLVAAVNGLRDRPPGTALELGPLPSAIEVRPELESLLPRAVARRPEVAAAEVMIGAAEAAIRLAEKDYRPDVTLGLTYTVVSRREDRAGRLDPPEGNGDDDLGLTASVNLPVRKARLAAAVEEASAREREAREARRAAVAAIERDLGDLALRLPLTWERLRLFEDVLTPQAEESLRSAEAGYAAGTLRALDLLDAERVLLEVRIATARAVADYSIAVAELEGSVGGPITSELRGGTP